MSRFVSSEVGNEELSPIVYWQQSILSLEKALEPVMFRFNELDRSIRLAKNHFSQPSKHGLTLDESAAIYLYTMEAGDHSFYRVMNKDLRNKDRTLAKPWIPYLKLFDSAITKLPVVQKNIWRALKGNLRDGFKKDEILTWWSVTSCSPSINSAGKFLASSEHGTMLMIEAKNARDISGYTFYPNENEYILKSGTYLRVKDDPADINGSAIVHLVELNDDEKPAKPAKLSLPVKTRPHIILE